MSKKLIINIVACVAAVAIVITSGVFVVRHYNSKEEVVMLSGEPGEQTYQDAQAVVEDETTTGAPEITTESQAAPASSGTGSSGGSATPSYTPSTPTGQGSSPAPQIKPSGQIDVSDQDKKDVEKFNEKTPATDKNATKEAGTFGFMWNDDDKVFYSAKDPWQRKFGYNKIYDFSAPFVIMFFDSVRVKFNWGGYDWMVQLWKGQYGYVLLGAEVGVYYKKEGTPIEHYECADDNNRLKVGYTTYDKGQEIFKRDYQETWWLTGFVPGKLDKFADRSEMAMTIRVTLKDANMTKAFAQGLKNIADGKNTVTKAKQSFREGAATIADPDTFYVKGNDVYMSWQYISEIN